MYTFSRLHPHCTLHIHTVPESKAKDKDAVCARCYGLQHYGKVDPSLTAQKAVFDAVSPEAFR